MKFLDCRKFREMLISARNNLANNKAEIDKLNVFPVPDGDTGTNMYMTFSYGVNEIENFKNDYVGDTAKQLSKNMLMGARGNSGVILSQIFKGIAKSFESLQKVTVEDTAKALANGSKVAYKAVMRPVEGTILTVIRETADYGLFYFEKNPKCSFEEFFTYVLNEARQSLERTIDLLPALKEANVVDSGGAGLVCILEGICSYLNGKPIELKDSKSNSANLSGYKAEMSISLNDLYKKEFNADRIKNILGKYCENIELKRENNTVYFEGITNNPGETISTLFRFGEANTINVRKLTEEDLNKVNTKKEHKKYFIISVCNGKGIADTFTSLGVDYIVSGGQTMNPATEDFVSIINEVDADNVFILPNNSNIIMAANQAKDICDDVNITVIPSKSIPQGINAMIHFNCDGEAEDNINEMNQAISSIKTASLTKAIKDSSYGNITIQKDDYIGIVDKDEIVSSEPDMYKALQLMLETVIDEDSCYATIIYGSQIDEQHAQKVLDFIIEKYDIEGELINGQQDLYPYIIGVE